MGSVNHITPKAIKKSIHRLKGFRVLDIARNNRCHYRVLVRDNLGNKFFVAAGSTCSSDVKRALMNIRTNAKQKSLRAQNVIE